MDNRPDNRRSEGNRQSAPRAATDSVQATADRGNGPGMQGVAFLHRESRPNTQPNRTHRPR